MVLSHLLQLGSSLAQRVRGKTIQCRTAVFLSLLLRKQFQAAYEIFFARPSIVAADIRSARLGSFVLDAQNPSILVPHLFRRIELNNSYRTDDVLLQACTSLMLAFLDTWVNTLQLEGSYKIERYLASLYSFTPTLSWVFRPVMVNAMANGLVYGALAIYLSDKYHTALWKNSKWEEKPNPSDRGVCAPNRARATPGIGIGATVTTIIRTGNNALSRGRTPQDENRLVTVFSVAHRFWNQVLKPAERGQLRDTTSSLDKQYEGKSHVQEILDNYIRTASLVFNIVITETKVPICFEVVAS